jgi:hypothetical protein
MTKLPSITSGRNERPVKLRSQWLSFVARSWLLTSKTSCRQRTSFNGASFFLMLVSEYSGGPGSERPGSPS